MTRGKGMPRYARHDKREGDASHSLGMTYSITLCHHSITLCHPERSEGSPHETPRRPSLCSGHLGMTRRKVPRHDKERGRGCLTTFGMTCSRVTPRALPEGSPHETPSRTKGGMPHCVWHGIPTCHPERQRGVSLPSSWGCLAFARHDKEKACHPERSEGSPHEIPRNSPAFARDVSE